MSRTRASPLPRCRSSPSPPPRDGLPGPADHIGAQRRTARACGSRSNELASTRSCHAILIAPLEELLGRLTPTELRTPPPAASDRREKPLAEADARRSAPADQHGVSGVSPGRARARHQRDGHRRHHGECGRRCDHGRGCERSPGIACFGFQGRARIEIHERLVHDGDEDRVRVPLTDTSWGVKIRDASPNIGPRFPAPRAGTATSRKFLAPVQTRQVHTAWAAIFGHRKNSRMFRRSIRAAAQEARVQGVVIMEVRIDERGGSATFEPSGPFRCSIRLRSTRSSNGSTRRR